VVFFGQSAFQGQLQLKTQERTSSAEATVRVISQHVRGCMGGRCRSSYTLHWTYCTLSDPIGHHAVRPIHLLSTSRTRPDPHSKNVVLNSEAHTDSINRHTANHTPPFGRKPSYTRALPRRLPALSCTNGSCQEFTIRSNFQFWLGEFIALFYRHHFRNIFGIESRGISACHSGGAY
jgi:hypothetical protein